jgi:hypothetical protein
MVVPIIAAILIYWLAVNRRLVRLLKSKFLHLLEPLQNGWFLKMII